MRRIRALLIGGFVVLKGQGPFIRSSTDQERVPQGRQAAVRTDVGSS
ncbi:hypothetical protein [Paenibacillus sp. CCS19]|nr:hypothetical protein [Paenibacillus cellulosilyticus]